MQHYNKFCIAQINAQSLLLWKCCSHYYIGVATLRSLLKAISTVRFVVHLGVCDSTCNLPSISNANWQKSYFLKLCLLSSFKVICLSFILKKQVVLFTNQSSGSCSFENHLLSYYSNISCSIIVCLWLSKVLFYQWNRDSAICSKC